jgi:phosphonatase-like hydrolase
MTKIELVIFDIAGTTVKDKGNVSIAFIDAFKEYGRDVPQDEVNKVMGFRKKDAIRILLDQSPPTSPDNYDELIEQIHDAFTRNIITSYENDTSLQPMPFAEETFAVLQQQGIKIALNTGFTRVVTDAILQRLEWTSLPTIDMVVCSDEVAQGRPYPFMINAIMQHVHVTDSRAIAKVGDTPVDVAEGREANCGLVISVTTGASTRHELEVCQPDHIIDSLQELPSLIF